jgi:hypothetical protein
VDVFVDADEILEDVEEILEDVDLILLIVLAALRTLSVSNISIILSARELRDAELRVEAALDGRERAPVLEILQSRSSFLS